MTTQPEALHLSLLLAQVAPYLEVGERGQWIMSAAAELSRLHEVNAELLAALNWISTVNAMDYEYQAIARSAINKAERTTP